MAKTKKRPPVDDLTLYDIDPAFQDKLIAWLSKKPHGVVVDIGATDDAFKVTFDPGGETINASFEDALNEAMGSRARAKRIDPQLEERIHKFLLSMNAHLTFGASRDGVFNMTVSNDQARGASSDEDFEIALVLAEEQFWEDMPARPLPEAKRVALAAALVPAAQREAEREAAIEEMVPPRMRSLALSQPTMMVPPPGTVSAAEEQRAAIDEMLPPGMRGLVKNRMRYSEWVGEVNDTLQRAGYDFYDAQVDYWRTLYQAGFGPQQAAEEFETTWLAERGYVGNKRRPPPPPSSKPFDPEAPREHYAKPHHFSVNAAWSRSYINSLPDSAFLYVEPGGDKDEHGRTHPLSLRHLPYKNRKGSIDQSHLKNALARVHQEGTRLPKHVKETVFKKAQAIYDREFGYAGEMAANESFEENARRGRWPAHMRGIAEAAKHAPGGEYPTYSWAPTYEMWSERPDMQADEIASRRYFIKRWGYDPVSPERDWEAMDRARGLRKNDSLAENAHPMAAGGGHHGMSRSMRARGMDVGAGSWRIHVAGGDIDPSRFRDYDEATQHARGKYGPGGWTVEWQATMA